MSTTISGTHTVGLILTTPEFINPTTIAGEVIAALGAAISASSFWTIDNVGSIIATEGEGVSLSLGGGFTNAGVVSAASYAVFPGLGQNFYIDNENNGTLIGGGSDALRLSGDVTGSTLINDGLIANSYLGATGGAGLQLGAASATNMTTGVIQGGSLGVALENVSTFVNLGTVTGATGILVAAGQNNVSIIDGGLISATVGDAISFAAGSELDFLTLLPGVVLDGTANGGGSADVVFAGTMAGTLGNIGHALTMFPSMTVAGGAEWELSGSSTVTVGFENDGTVVERTGDVLTFLSPVTGHGTIDLAGGVAVFANTVSSGETVEFSQANSTLMVSRAHAFSGTISGFTGGDTIEVTGFGGGQQVTGTVSGDVLILNDGVAPVTLTFSSSPASVIVAPIGGTAAKSYEIIAPCFRAGTHLLTPTGPRRVETLRKGNMLVTHDGVAKPIIWHGHRRVNCRRHPKPETVWPILIESGAFGAGVPSRDLYLSPDHALYCDGVLIQAKYLVNGVSVRQVEVEDVVYHHVELATHEVVWAETLPAETYLDCGNRHQFAHRKGVMALFSDFAPPRWAQDRACAPLADEGDALVAVRERLHRRLESKGIRRGAGTFTVTADGRGLEATDVKSCQKLFRLPVGSKRLRINSSACAPAEIDPFSSDRRRLGIAITDIAVDGSAIGSKDDRFCNGFYEAERRGRRWFRWTDGRAELDVSGVRELSFTVQAIAPIWHVPAPRRDVSGRRVLESHSR
ncbi:MAG: Hint domain-containing protein [Acidiphilium sp.]